MTSNATVGGTLEVTGATTLTGQLNLPTEIANASTSTLTVVDDAASAFTIGSTGKADILKIVSTDLNEGVKMSGTLEVTGATTLTGQLNLPTAIANAAASTLTVVDNAASAFTIGSTGKQIY